MNSRPQLTQSAWCEEPQRFPRLPGLRHVTKNSSPQLLYNLVPTNCDACNSFRICSYANCRVSLPSPGLNSLNLRTLSALSLLLSSSCTLFCTHAKFNFFVFMRFRTLCQEYLRGIYTERPCHRSTPPVAALCFGCYDLVFP